MWKVSSTSADPAQGVGEALAQVAAPASDVAYFGDGTTVATNALIQRKGAPTGVVTSDGFRNLLEIGRQKRPGLYDLQADKPPVLAARAWRREVSERLRYDGHIETPLDHAAVRDAARFLRDAGVEAVAICFLYSFYGTETVLAVGDALQDYAELRMRAGIAALPDGVYRFGAGVEPFVRGSGTLRAGQTVEIITPGAGSYGPPCERDPAAIARDLADAAIYSRSW